MKKEKKIVKFCSENGKEFFNIEACEAENAKIELSNIIESSDSYSYNSINASNAVEVMENNAERVIQLLRIIEKGKGKK